MPVPVLVLIVVVAVVVAVAGAVVADTATVGDFLLPKRNRADTPNVAPIGVFSAEDPAPGPVAVPAVDAPEVAELFRCIPDGLLVRLADVTLVRVLGKGSFGEAHLAAVHDRGPRVIKVHARAPTSPVYPPRPPRNAFTDS